MTVPLVDLNAQYISIKEEIDEMIADVIADSSFIRGPHVERFEAEFAAAIGAAQCVSCANGTDGLYIAMSALGVRPGDEVIVPAMSWISTSETVTQAGGTVVFCDTDATTHTLDPKRLSEVITSRTVGIIPVHLYGHPAKMDLIMDIASAYGLWVLEDCAQAHLAEFQGRKVGTFGIAGTFSFYPGKNLGAMGDAGAVVTNDASLAMRMAMFARHGGLRKHDHRIEGINSRLDGLQAAILNVKLPYLPAWTEQRSRLAARYEQLLGGFSMCATPATAEWAKNVWHVYQICVGNRDELMQHLSSKGIQGGVNYPTALPFLPCYRHLHYHFEDFPNAYNLSQKTLSLPIYPEMTDAQQNQVAGALQERVT